MKDNAYKAEFNDSFISTMAAFQLIEETLKLYIEFSYKLIQSRAKPFTFNYSVEDIRNNPLAQLVKKFKNLNSNVVLIDDLQKLTKIRNDIAHKILIEYIKSISDSNKNHLEEIKQTKIFAWSLFDRLNNEVALLDQSIKSH
jgi:archaellum biogenesis ATPase FlaH